MVGSKVMARNIDKHPGRDGEWFVQEREGLVVKDYLLAFSGVLPSNRTQSLYRVEFPDGSSANYWTDQLEVIEE